MLANPNPKPSLFGREPALIVGAVNALIAVAVGFGLNVTPEQVGLINAAVAAVLSVIVRAQVTPAAEVAERVKGGEVLAGPANDMVPAGAVVREVGQLPAPDPFVEVGLTDMTIENDGPDPLGGDSKAAAAYHGRHRDQD